MSDLSYRDKGFLCGSVGKEYACNAGDLASIPGLGWEDPLEKGMATHSSILAWRIPWTVWSMGSKSQTQLSDFHYHIRKSLRRDFEEQS